MKKEFKHPCAVETDSLTEDQGNALQEAFIKLGATLCDYYSDWNYYGVDYEGDTQHYSNIDSFADEDEEVVLFTYDEIMSFVAELEQPEEAPVTKKQLKFPCAIVMSEITSQEVYDKVFNAFIEAGAGDCEYFKENWYECEYEYFGVDYDKDTMHWDRLTGYKETYSSDGVTVYSLEDILDTTDQQEASSEPLGDVLADAPSVGIKESVEGGTEASEGSGGMSPKDHFDVNASGGMKETSGKLRWTLLPLLAVKEIVKVLEVGANKYSADNWKKVEPEKYKEAAFRHWTAYLEGEKVDPETGISHLAHLGCDVLFLLWFELTGSTNEKNIDRL